MNKSVTYYNIYIEDKIINITNSDQLFSIVKENEYITKTLQIHLENIIILGAKFTQSKVHSPQRTTTHEYLRHERNRH